MLEPVQMPDLNGGLVMLNSLIRLSHAGCVDSQLLLCNGSVQVWHWCLQETTSLKAVAYEAWQAHLGKFQVPENNFDACAE